MEEHPPPKTPNHPLKARVGGFTLSELLISLAILGVIATFSIPKVLNSQQNSQFNAEAKEAASMIASAYQAYKLNNVASSSTTLSDLMPYLNYVAVDTTTNIDAEQGLAPIPCSATGTRTCLKLHNGGLIHMSTRSFGGTGALNALSFGFDPDGKVTDGTLNGPGHSAQFWIYYTGRITTRGNIAAGTTDSGSTTNPDPTQDPPWLSW